MITKNIKFSLFLFFFLYISYGIGFIYPIKNFGIIPRQIGGIKGIILSPWIHTNLYHLINNSIPLLFLLIILSIKFVHSFKKILFYLTISTGVLVWIFASRGIHIGASGLIFALTSFLCVKMIIMKSIYLLLPLIIFFLYYGNIFSGLIPNQFLTNNNISYSSHWMGLIVGIGMAFIFKNKYNK